MVYSGSEDDSDVDIESVKDEEESGDSDRDEEEKWLDAVESGNVENHVDSELRSIQACPLTHFPILFTFIEFIQYLFYCLLFIWIKVL